MKKFNFTLQSILKLKEDLEENEKIVLYSLEEKHALLLKERIALKTVYRNTVIDRETAASAGTTSAKLAEYAHYLKELDRQIADKQLQIDSSEQAIAAQRQVLTEIRKEIKTLEKLRQSQLDEYNAAQTKQSENFIEDFISGRRQEQLGS